MQIPVRQPRSSRLRRATGAVAVLLACALPLAACDTDASDRPPSQADLKSKGCC